MSNNFTEKINIGTEKYSYDLTFGYSEEGNSEIYNNKFDRYAPPTPPMNFFDAALGLNGERYYSKIVKTTDEEVRFSIYLQIGDNPKINISWDNKLLNENLEYCRIKDAYGGKLDIDVDMLNENNLEIKNSLINVIVLTFKKK